MPVSIRSLVVIAALVVLPLSASAYSLKHTLKTGTIAFGSCLKQWQPQPVWASVTALEPQAFVFLGDNVYTDVGAYTSAELPGRIGQAYKELSRDKAFKRFGMQKKIDIFATWDDHDYGVNDGGAEFPYQQESREYFADFFGLELDRIGDQEKRGVFYADFRDIGGLTVQFIMLDTRSYRSPLSTGPTSSCPKNRRVPTSDPGATVLGDLQWQWLELELKKPADLRIIASSIQVLPTEHCFEKWNNFPHERQRLFSLLNSTEANGVLLISGDRHMAEISRLDGALSYPLYEITASGLNSALSDLAALANETNTLRTTPRNIVVDNFGTIQITREGEEALLQLQVRNVQGEVMEEVRLKVSDLGQLNLDK